MVDSESLTTIKRLQTDIDTAKMDKTRNNLTLESKPFHSVRSQEHLLDYGNCMHLYKLEPTL